MVEPAGDAPGGTRDASPLRRERPAAAAKVVTGGLSASMVFAFMTAMGWQGAFPASDDAPAPPATTYPGVLPGVVPAGAPPTVAATPVGPSEAVATVPVADAAAAPPPSPLAGSVAVPAPAPAPVAVPVQVAIPVAIPVATPGNPAAAAGGPDAASVPSR